MVEYSNPQPPEGINSSSDNPIKELLLLGVGIIAVLVLLFLIISYSAGWIATKLPFKYEASIGDQVFESSLDFPASPELQALADRLGAVMQLDPELQISVHYSPDDTVNAFAFIGGHIVIYQGLLNKLESENALAMVMAHEIAHVQHRDVAKSLGRGLALTLVVSALFGDGSNVAGTIANGGVQAGLLNFSRGQESEADEAALAAVNQLYGHTHGALQLYQVLLEEEGKHSGPWQVEFLSTHPLTATRMNELSAQARERGWHDQGELTPLPEL